MFQNDFKRKMLAGENCYGILDSTASCEIVEMLGYLGFDFVLLDAEHGKLNLENLENLIRAAELAGIAPIVRPPVIATQWIAPMLDRGAWGLYLPHFATADDARLAVRAAKYAPEGMRGYMPVGRPNHFGYDMSVSEFLKVANEEIVIIGLVEDAEGLDNLDEMLTVDGVDAFWIGAGDLSQSMGHPGQADHPDVMAAMDVAIAKIVDAGKVAGWAGNDLLIPHYMALGATLFHGLVQGLMRTGAEQYLADRKAELLALGR